MNDDEKKIKEERTPITDGDTRPDQQPDGSPKKDLKRNKAPKDFTANRAGDVNSLEDYKDKKAD
jgi:hypothetical protein